MIEAILTRFETRAMGSVLRLTVCPTTGDADAYGDAVASETAWAEVVDEFERSEQAMSRFRDGSELTALNRAAGTGLHVSVGRRLERAVVAADRAHRVTGGTFDPRVLGDLVRLGYEGAGLPASRPAAPPPQAGDPVIRRSAPGRLRVDRPIDLGGIGKGLALRWTARRLDRHGTRSYLLEAGGDLVARGAGPGADGWRVGIEDPSGGGSPVAVIAVRDLAVTTSSVGVHAWVVDGRPVHHLLDPATGQPGGDGLLAVTVAAADPAWAEVWSKTLFLTGRDGIAGRARGHGLAAWWIGTDGRLEMTPAARVRTVWVAAEIDQTVGGAEDLEGPPQVGGQAGPRAGAVEPEDHVEREHRHDDDADDGKDADDVRNLGRRARNRLVRHGAPPMGRREQVGQ